MAIEPSAPRPACVDAAERGAGAGVLEALRARLAREDHAPQAARPAALRAGPPR